MIGLFVFGALVLGLLALAWWLTDEAERLGQIAERDEGEWL